VVIKEKKGDIFDLWVLRHNQSLLVKNTVNDFRFDVDKSSAFKERHIRSLIASPVCVGDRLLGILRAESTKVNSFSLDESRLLRSISDIGGMVLERINLFKRIEELAIRDPLTGLSLRSYFLQRLEEEIKRAYLKDRSLGIIMLDIDDFKQVNDTHGHIVGDLVLRKLARILRNVVGKGGNLICRYGGEEFTVFTLNRSLGELKKLTETLRKRVENTEIKFRKQKLTFTVSIGVAIFPQDGDEPAKLIEQADTLLYKAKRQGKNRVCFTI